LSGAVQDFGWCFCKREVQIDLPLRRTPLPLLRRLGKVSVPARFIQGTSCQKHRNKPCHFNHQQQRQRKEKQIKSVMDFSFLFHQAEVFHQA
jgi:hypothetical protein